MKERRIGIFHGQFEVAANLSARATMRFPVAGLSPVRSYSSQYSPEPRFCHIGRSLKLMPSRKSSSFLAETVRPRIVSVAAVISRPCFLSSQ